MDHDVFFGRGSFWGVGVEVCEGGCGFESFAVREVGVGGGLYGCSNFHDRI